MLYLGLVGLMFCSLLGNSVAWLFCFFLCGDYKLLFVFVLLSFLVGFVGLMMVYYVAPL